MIKRRMRRGIRRLPGLLRTLDRALVDRGVENALALLGAILRMHRSADLRTLGCQWHVSTSNRRHERQPRPRRLDQLGSGRNIKIAHLLTMIGNVAPIALTIRRYLNKT